MGVEIQKTTTNQYILILDADDFYNIANRMLDLWTQPTEVTKWRRALQENEEDAFDRLDDEIGKAMRKVIVESRPKRTRSPKKPPSTRRKRLPERW